MSAAQGLPMESRDDPPDDIFSVLREDDDGELIDTDSSKKPEVFLPGGSMSISESGKAFGRLLADTESFYFRGGAVVRLDEDDSGEPILRAVKPAELASAIESVARIVKWAHSKGGPIKADAICNEQTAKLILNSREFREQLPSIRLLSACPVLVVRDGELIQVCGYDRRSGVMAFGDAAPDDIPVGEAVSYLGEVLGDFRFASPSDRSRAVAAIITPTLVHGDLLGGRAPLDLGEADQSQTGKGYRNKVTAAIYGQQVRPITQKKQGVGSLEESFNRKLIEAANFISLDNMRGKIDSPAIESFMTEDLYTARVPYSPEVEIETKRIVLMMTSNRADITPDLANRSSCTRLLKQDDGHKFIEHPEGDLLDHVRANQPLYLGCVFSVVREWLRHDRPRTRETRHDFRKWAQALDWIVQEIFQEAPLLDGHRETQRRMTNPVLNWLRDVAIVVCKAGHGGQWLRAHDLLDTLADTDVEIPGVSEGDDLDDDLTRNRALPLIGRKMRKAFAGTKNVEIDQIAIDRQEVFDEQSRKRHEYRFAKVGEP